MVQPTSKTLLVLTSKLGYQVRGFAEAARKLGVEVAIGSDRCHQLEDPWRDGAIPLHFEKPEEAAARIVEQPRAKPFHGILALGDRPIRAAALAARALGLTYNSPESVDHCFSKLRQREVLRAAGVAVPEFFSFQRSEDLGSVARRAKYPCVLKPVLLAASQGVIRANNAEEFMAAARRIEALLETPEIQVTREQELDRLLVERYVEGPEVAVEALLTNGELRVLAIFDKPDPLEGPYFEETIYVTPSRLPAYAQILLKSSLRAAANALGLTHGPVHAEFRVNEEGAWVLEVQPRPIGGLCARALQFEERKDEEKDTAETQRTQRGAEKITLEELLVRHALGQPCTGWEREREASGVMMIPVPQSGVFEGVEGVDEAAAVPGVTEIEITTRLHDYVAAWPEGSSYLGFIFARAALPEEVEAALRAAHAKLRFTMAPRLPVEHPARRIEN